MVTQKEAEPPPIAIGDVEQPVMQGSQIQVLLPQTTSDEKVNLSAQSLKMPNMAISGNLGQNTETVVKQKTNALYPYSGLFPVDSERFLAQKLIEQQKLATESFLSTNLPDFQSIELTDTPFVQKIFDQTMEMFKANYTDLEGGWQDAVKLAIKYTSQGFANMVESKAVGVNDKVFGVGMNEWNKLKKYSGVGARA